MITAKFILNNYTDSKFIKTNRKAGNATYFYKNGKQYLVTRETDYVYGVMPNGLIKMYLENDGTNIIHSDEALHEINGTEGKFIKYLTKTVPMTNNDYGFEDPRCIKWNDKQYIMFNRRNLRNFSNVQMHIGEIDDNFNYVNDKTLPNLIQVEKNWQPIERIPGECVYSYKPFKLVNVFTGKFREIPNSSPIDFRGSSQIVKFDEYNLGIVHQRNYMFEYMHHLILFDKNLKILKISDPFSFFGANVEFVAHAEYDKELKILVNVHDQIIYEFSLNEEIIKNILDKKYTNNKKENKVFTRFYNDAILNGNVFGALGIATFSKDLDVLYDAVQKNHNKNYFRGFQRGLQEVLIRNTK